MPGGVTLFSYAPGGYHGHVVTVEVDCRRGIPGMDIVGLPASEIREARDRVRVGIRNSGFSFPPSRILISLSPADLPKSGNGFDLAIATGVLASTNQTVLPHDRVMVMGEVHLGGAITPVRGVLAALAEGRLRGLRCAIVPRENLREAAMVRGMTVVGIDKLADVSVAVRLIEEASHPGESEGPLLLTAHGPLPAGETSEPSRSTDGSTPARADLEQADYSRIRGLAALKRVLEVAAAGGHHLLVVGPPGGGKSASLALFPTILPLLTESQSVEVTRIHSLAGGGTSGPVRLRPFRMPHHSATAEGLLGGRSLLPGEVALAHHGTLFLDEALEFRRPVLQGLREPLEHGRVRVTRSGLNYWYPARIQLLLATNRCPCGMLGRSDHSCLCSVSEVERYWRKLGGPLMDRVDLRLPVHPQPLDQLPETDASSTMRACVSRAIEFRKNSRVQHHPNSRLTAAQATSACAMTLSVRSTFSRATQAFHLSTRASLSVLRVARTVADIAGRERVEEADLLEAVSYRKYGEDRPPWREPEADASPWQ